MVDRDHDAFVGATKVVASSECIFSYSLFAESHKTLWV
jgi:hypothetical protein